jgi:antitoxin component of RelBE/YafQ-DinJ toxin-antitoxin module
MTVLLRCRVKKEVLEKANRITKKLGTSTPEMVRIFLAEIGRTGSVPLRLKTDDKDDLVSPWEQRAGTLESFYDSSKAW